MIRRSLSFVGFLFALILGGMLTSSLGQAQGTIENGVSGITDQLDGSSLKTILEGLGYELKTLNAEAGKEKYSFTVKTNEFNIPIGAEVAPSKTYVWLTVSVGSLTEKHSPSALLKENSKIQPSQFYLSSKDMIVIGLPIENRGITPAILKSRIEKVTKDIGSTSTLWNKP